MRVLHVGKFYPPHWGGMETAIKDICEVLAPRIQLEAVVAADSRRPAREVLGGVTVTRLANWGLLFSQPLVSGLHSFLRRRQAEVVHLHEPNPLAMASFLASGSRASLVVHYHSDIVRQRLLGRLYRPILERGLERASAVIVGSQELIDSSPVLGRWRHKCVVIPFGIDLSPFLSIERRPGPAAEPLILAVGRLSYYKGFHYLIDAMRAVPAARLVLVGEGEQRRELEAAVARSSLSGRVHLTGRVDMAGLVEWYRRADLFCLPSCERSEAFGLVQLEAMGAALPVISTDLPTGMRAINLHGRTGLVVPPHDTTRLAAALNQLATDAGLRARLGVSGRERARLLFSREVMGNRILELYSAVAGGRQHTQEVPS